MRQVIRALWDTSRCAQSARAWLTKCAREFDLEKLRKPLRKMTDAQLLEFGRAGRRVCSPEANFGKLPREVFVIQLREARAEWRRSHPKT
jgi:hypothetical protein